MTLPCTGCAGSGPSIPATRTPPTGGRSARASATGRASPTRSPTCWRAGRSCGGPRTSTRAPGSRPSARRWNAPRPPALGRRQRGRARRPCRGPVNYPASQSGARLASVMPLRSARRQRGQQFVADMSGGDPGDLGVVVARRYLHDVRADQVQPRRTSAARRAVRGWSGRLPPGCRCPARAPGRARRCRPRRRRAGRRPARRSARHPGHPEASASVAATTWKPSPASWLRSVGANSGPRIPTWMQPDRSSRPSSDARRNGVPCVYAAPK